MGSFVGSIPSASYCQEKNKSLAFKYLTISGKKDSNKCIFTSMKSNIDEFEQGVFDVCEYLAKEIARDGEGATTLIVAKVSGARSEKEAKIAARAIVSSDLLKCAVYGRDYNLCRIYAAVGASSAKIDKNKIKADMKFGKGETLVTCDLGVGNDKATAWGCDMTEGYIKINAHYHT